MKKQKVRGSKRMQEFGYHAVTLWLDAGEWAALDNLRREKKSPRATLIRELLCFELKIPFNRR